MVLFPRYDIEFVAHILSLFLFFYNSKCRFQLKVVMKVTHAWSIVGSRDTRYILLIIYKYEIPIII